MTTIAAVRNNTSLVSEHFKKKNTRLLKCTRVIILAVKVLFSGGLILLVSEKTRLEFYQIFKRKKADSRLVLSEAHQSTVTSDKVEHIFNDTLMDEVFQRKTELYQNAYQLSSDQAEDIHRTALKVTRAIFADAEKLSLFKNRLGLASDEKMASKIFKGAYESILLASQQNGYGGGLFRIPSRNVSPLVQKVFGDNILAIQNTSSQVTLLMVQERIGQGTFNKVFWAIEFPSGQFRAYRKLIEHKDPKRLEVFQEEHAIHLQLQEAPTIKKQVVKLHQVFKKSSLLTLCKGTVIQTYLSQRESKKVIIDIVKGLNAMHQQGYVHCDIKPENLFVKRTKGGAVKGKIGDFGGTFNSVQKRFIVGSYYYFSPESFLSKVFSPASDCWALGITLYEFKYKKRNKGRCELPNLQFLDKILKEGKGNREKIQGLFKEGSKEIKKLLNPKDPYDKVVQALLNLNAKKRITASKALERLQRVSAHHFIQYP